MTFNWRLRGAPPTLIGLGGYARAGKDAVADALAPEVRKFFMSEPVNEALLKIDPIIPWHNVMGEQSTYLRAFHPVELRYSEYFSTMGGYAGYDQVKDHPEVRALLQRVGTEMGRTMFGADCWLSILFTAIDDHIGDGSGRAAVTGIRFANELGWITARFGLPVWVRRPGVYPVNAHSSDNSLTEEDFLDAGGIVVDNSGTLDDLRMNVRGRLT